MCLIVIFVNIIKLKEKKKKYFVCFARLKFNFNFYVVMIGFEILVKKEEELYRIS